MDSKKRTNRVSFLMDMKFHILLFAICIACISGCLETKREFKSTDFESATRFFCQKPKYSGSPLTANSYIVYYSKEEGIGNIGQLVYMGDYEWSPDVGEGHVFATDTAYVNDDYISMYLEHLRDDKLLTISINRKDLQIKIDNNDMDCALTDDAELQNLKAKLLKQHEAYEKKQDVLNKI